MQPFNQKPTDPGTFRSSLMLSYFQVLGLIPVAIYVYFKFLKSFREKKGSKLFMHLNKQTKIVKQVIRQERFNSWRLAKRRWIRKSLKNRRSLSSCRQLHNSKIKIWQRRNCVFSVDDYIADKSGDRELKEYFKKKH